MEPNIYHICAKFMVSSTEGNSVQNKKIQAWLTTIYLEQLF